MRFINGKIRTTFFAPALALTFLTSATASASFDWGSDCSAGNGEFAQHVPYLSLVSMGTIPANKKDVVVALQSATDVDLQIIAADGTAIVKWPNGLLSRDGYACTFHDGVEYCYSGYNGVGGQPGHERIEIHGVTNQALEIRAFGYAAGDATVGYQWRPSPTCNEVGGGSFTQYVGRYDTTLVGEVPAGKTNVVVELRAGSDRDVDIQLWHGNIPVVAWPQGLLNGPGFGSIEYEGMTIEYSGYNGVDGYTWGHERINIIGRVTRTLTVAAFGYQSGGAHVDYRWGEGVGTPCGETMMGEVYSCASGLMCKGQNRMADGLDECHTPTWCAGAETASDDCANLYHIAVPGSWGCESFQCVWQTGPVNQDPQCNPSTVDLDCADSTKPDNAIWSCEHSLCVPRYPGEDFQAVSVADLMRSPHRYEERPIFVTGEAFLGGEACTRMMCPADQPDHPACMPCPAAFLEAANDEITDENIRLLHTGGEIFDGEPRATKVIYGVVHFDVDARKVSIRPSRIEEPVACSLATRDTCPQNTVCDFGCPSAENCGINPPGLCVSTPDVGELGDTCGGYTAPGWHNPPCEQGLVCFNPEQAYIPDIPGACTDPDTILERGADCSAEGTVCDMGLVCCAATGAPPPPGSSISRVCMDPAPGTMPPACPLLP